MAAVKRSSFTAHGISAFSKRCSPSALELGMVKLPVTHRRESKSSPRNTTKTFSPKSCGDENKSLPNNAPTSSWRMGGSTHDVTVTSQEEINSLTSSDRAGVGRGTISANRGRRPGTHTLVCDVTTPSYAFERRPAKESHYSSSALLRSRKKAELSNSDCDVTRPRRRCFHFTVSIIVTIIRVP